MQRFNEFNFNQENKVADFDNALYQQKIGNRLSEHNAANTRFNQYKDPLGQGVSTGLNTYQTLGGGGGASGGVASGGQNPMSSAFSDRLNNVPLQRKGSYLRGRGNEFAPVFNLGEY